MAYLGRGVGEKECKINCIVCHRDCKGKETNKMCAFLDWTLTEERERAGTGRPKFLNWA
jgi:hypothetical protein